MQWFERVGVDSVLPLTGFQQNAIERKLTLADYGTD